MADTDKDKDHKNYRDSGIAFSLTLITLSSALIYWARSLIELQPPINLSQKVITLFLMGFACATIMASLAIQFCHYHGYKHQARVVFGQSTPAQATKWFDSEDASFYAASCAFLITTALAVVLFVCRI